VLGDDKAFDHIATHFFEYGHQKSLKPKDPTKSKVPAVYFVHSASLRAFTCAAPGSKVHAQTAEERGFMSPPVLPSPKKERQHKTCFLRIFSRILQVTVLSTL
jgi:hypothetical protein